MRLLPEVAQIVQSINRAVKAEEKQGYINTGAMAVLAAIYLKPFRLDHIVPPQEALRK